MPLDNPSIFKKLDQGRVAESISYLPHQLRQVLSDAEYIKIPREYAQIKNVVINGMGGSNLGARIIKSVMLENLSVPFNIEPGYQIPGYVNSDTLFVISSYSGTTEEPLSVYKEVKRRRAKILAICSKGKGQLEKMIMKDNIPGYIFDPVENPCGEPRLGVGYSVFGMMVMLAKAGLFKIKVKEIEEIINSLEIRDRRLRVSEPTRNNAAKQLALQSYNHIPILVGAEHLEGGLHALRNQFCESSKNFCDYLTIPDLNHFAMEGLSFPITNNKNMIFLLFQSQLFHPRIQKRIKLTKEVIKKYKIPVISYELKCETKIEQAFELLQLGSWLTFYVGILNNIDPVKTPWVAWFKKKLA